MMTVGSLTPGWRRSRESRTGNWLQRLKLFDDERAVTSGIVATASGGVAGHITPNLDHPNWHRSSEATGCYELRVAIHRLLNDGTDQ